MASAAEDLHHCFCGQQRDADPKDEVPKDREQFRHYVKHGPIQPIHSEVRKTADLKGRTFQASWYSKYNWLEYSVSARVAFCFLCRLFATGITFAQRRQGGGHAAPDPAFTQTGFSTWSNALAKNKGFDKHENTAAHRHARDAYKRFMEEKPVDAQLDEGHARALTAKQASIVRNRQTLGRIFLVILLLARLGLAFRGHAEGPALNPSDVEDRNRGNFLELIHFLAAHGDELLRDHVINAPRNASYLSPATQNEMIQFVGDAILKEIRARVQEAKYFVIMMDETRDTSHKEQVIIMVRYVRRVNGKFVVEERMIAIVTPGKTTGEALEILLLSVLQANGFELSNCVGQCYDGGGNMAGAYKGVQARVLEKNSLAEFTHCFAHSLNRAVVNSMNHKQLPEARKFFGNLQLIVSFINASVNRHEHFMKLQERYIKEMKFSHRPVVPGKGISDTRWYCRASTLHRFTSPPVFKAMVETLEHIARTDNDAAVVAMASGLSKCVTTPNFILLLAAFKPVLTSVNVVSECLQSPKTDISAALDRVASLKSEMSRLRSDEAWERAQVEAHDLANCVSLDLSEAIDDADQTTRKRKRPRTVDSRPETEVQLSYLDKMRTQHYFPSMDKLMSELNARFPSGLRKWQFLQPKHFSSAGAEEAIKELAAKYNIDQVGCAAEWRLFRFTKDLENKSMAEVGSMIPEGYNALQTLYQIFLTVPVTTASVERGFSKMALIKNDLRSVMGQDRLQSLMLASVEYDICKAVNPEDLVAEFAKAADRRMLLG